MISRRNITGLALFVLLLHTGCHSGKPLSAAREGNVLLSERSKGWLKYQVYLLPQEQATTRQDKMMLHIRIINMENNTSPLRRLCTSLDDYNEYYEYLLNHCKEDITVSAGGTLFYPVSYSFENNYNAFPFETINVGYNYSAEKKQRGGVALTYNDKVFAHDTINFNLNNIER